MTTVRSTFLAVGICLFYSSLTLALPPSSRIWDGEDVGAGEAPYVTSVRVDGGHKCGGSIIAARYVVTAAQCVAAIATMPVPATSVTVRVGSINQFAGGEIVNVERIEIHPAYGNFLNDIAILVLASSLEWSEKVAAIPLPTSVEPVAPGSTVTVQGWGLQHDYQSPYKLQHLEATVVGRPFCEYEVGFGYEQTICLSSPAGKGICTGDAGGGIIANNVLVAVASFAFGGCGTTYSDVSTNVAYFLPWINSIIG